MEQGRLAACHMFGNKSDNFDNLLPYGIYSIPEISIVGWTEEKLTADAIPYEAGIAYYKETARGQLLGDDIGMLKMLIHQESKAVLGVHIIGTNATELVHIGQCAIAFKATAEYFVNTVFNYPTLAECYKIAANGQQARNVSLPRALSPPWLGTSRDHGTRERRRKLRRGLSGAPTTIRAVSRSCAVF